MTRLRGTEVLSAIGVSESHLGFVDLFRQAARGLNYRMGRTILTALSTSLAVGALVATMGLSSTASRQVSDEFDALRATEVTVQDARPEVVDVAPFTPDAEQRLLRLDGVVRAGIWWTSSEDIPVSRSTLSSVEPERLPLLAATPGALDAFTPRLSVGRLYDAFHEGRAEPVALLGRAAAAKLGITRIDNQPAVFVGERPLTVIGIVDDVVRRPEVMMSVIVPASTGERLPGVVAMPTEMLVETAPGAAQTIAGQAPLALRPDDPSRLTSIAPPDPEVLRRHVEGDIGALVGLVAAVALVVGMLGIASSSLVAVLERTPEIGLRRALGARRWHVAAQVLAETTFTGTVAGAVGASVGVVLVVAVSAARGWAPVLDPAVPLGAPFLGTVTGLVAGLQPARRASRVDPVVALQR